MVFQTKSFSEQPIFGAIFVIIGVIGFIILAGVIFASLFSWEGKKFRDLGLQMALTITWLVLWAGVGGFLVYQNPLKEEIKINNRAEEITVERTYIVRQWSPLRTSFDAIMHVTYYYWPSRPFGAGGYGDVGSDASGAVKLTNRDGVEVEVSYGRPQAQHELAKAIARHTGKRLRSQ